MSASLRQPSLLSAALALALSAQSGAALEFIATNTYTVSEGQTLQAELWCYAGGATIAGTAQNDLFLFVDASAASGKHDAGLWRLLLSSGATMRRPKPICQSSPCQARRRATCGQSRRR